MTMAAATSIHNGQVWCVNDLIGQLLVLREGIFDEDEDTFYCLISGITSRSYSVDFVYE